MNASALTVKDFLFHGDLPVRVALGVDGQPWFRADDVCAALGFGNPRQALSSHVDEDDVQKLDTIDSMGRNQSVSAGCYLPTRRTSSWFDWVVGWSETIASRPAQYISGQIGWPDIRLKGAIMEQFFENAVDTIQFVGKLLATLVLRFPFAVVGILIGVSVIVYAADSGSAPTIQQQIAHYNRPGGTMHWVMQENGENPSGFLDLDSYGNKKQEADFYAAVKFCNSDKTFNGCDKVIKAANAPDFGPMGM